MLFANFIVNPREKIAKIKANKYCSLEFLANIWLKINKINVKEIIIYKNNLIF
jgi:hypothetical protein